MNLLQQLLTFFDEQLSQLLVNRLAVELDLLQQIYHPVGNRIALIGDRNELGFEMLVGLIARIIAALATR